MYKYQLSVMIGNWNEPEDFYGQTKNEVWESSKSWIKKACGESSNKYVAIQNNKGVMLKYCSTYEELRDGFLTIENENELNIVHYKW
jgi:hypothetical protein